MPTQNLLPRPPFDPEIMASMLALPPTSDDLTTADIPAQRETVEQMLSARTAALLSDPSITHTEHTIPGPREPITLSVLAPTHPKTTAPKACIYHLHGGGMFCGIRFLGLDPIVAWLKRGTGGELPPLRAQMLVCPMLDDASASVSARQWAAGCVWSGRQNAFGWGCLLDGSEGGGDCYAAPARAADLAGLPEAFVDVSSTEVFRDDAVAYAGRLWECGVQAELHVWPDGPHGFHGLAPAARVSRAANEAQEAWVRRVLRAVGE